MPWLTRTSNSTRPHTSALPSNNPRSDEGPAGRRTNDGPRWRRSRGAGSGGPGWVWWVATQRHGSLPPMQVLSLTTFPGFEATPTFSPDGRQVAFSWDGEQRDNDDIYVMLVGADLPHRLTTNPAKDVSPAWKPDGSQIAFARLDDAHVGIYVASPLGGAEQRIATFPPASSSTFMRGSVDPSLSWSPDGRWLAVSRVAADNPSTVHVVAQDGSETRQVLLGEAGHDYTSVAFSPNGDALAFVDSGYLGVVEIDPKDPSKQRQPSRRLSAYQRYVGGLAWTRDGRELLYGRAPYAAPPPSYLWRLAVDGSSSPQRLDLAGVASFPALSPSGQRLAFSRRDLNIDLFLLMATKGVTPSPHRLSTSSTRRFRRISRRLRSLRIAPAMAMRSGSSIAMALAAGRSR